MGKGLSKYDSKEKRKVRRRNHIARDLLSSKQYREQTIKRQRQEDEDERRFRRYKEWSGSVDSDS